MSEQASYFKIGLFIITAVVLAVAGVIALGIGAFARDELVVETYIEESVQGLEVGSPLRFRGVQLGEVTMIDLVAREYDTESWLVLVRVAVERDALLGDPVEKVSPREWDDAVTEGLRMQLASQGITGTLYLEADFVDPERHPVAEIDWHPRHPYIPSIPATLTRFTESLDQILTNLDDIDVVRLATRLQETLEGTSNLLRAVDLQTINTEAVGLVTELRVTNQRLQEILATGSIEALLTDAAATAAVTRRIAEENEGPLRETLAPLPETAASARTAAANLESFTSELTGTLALLQRTLARLDLAVYEQEPEIADLLENLRVISDNLRDLTENAKRYPSHTLFGNPPRPVEAVDQR